MSRVRTIEQSVLIQARIGQVWDVLTTPRLIAQWANTFMPGMYAESAWLKGCEVQWKGPDGAVMLRGRVEQAVRGKMLKVVFDRELNPDIPEEAMAFSETYALTSEDGAVRLDISAGPMREEEYKVLHGAWGKVIEDIRTLAEAGGAAQMGPRLARPVRQAAR